MNLDQMVEALTKPPLKKKTYSRTISFKNKEISLIVAALNVMRNDFEFAGQKEAAANVDVLISKLLKGE